MGLSYLATNPEGQRWVITPEKTDYKENASTNAADTYQTAIDLYIAQEGKDGDEMKKMVDKKKELLNKDKANDDANKANAALNTANTKKNEAYQNVVNIANNTVGKDYKTQREFIKQLDVDEATKTKLENSFNIFYSNEKLPLASRWDPNKALNAPVPLSERYKNTEFAATEGTLDIVNAALKNASKAEPSKIFNETDKKFTKKFIAQAGFKSNEELVQFLGKQGETGTTLLTVLQAGTLTNENLENLEKQKTELDATIKELENKKNRDLKLTFKDGEKIPEEVAVEASFARQFIDEYLKPRFDYSKSMDEFRDYMNVDKEYKNPFQTTDRLTQIKDYAYTQAKQIAENLKDETYNELYIDSNFDENFYMNPEDKYANENKQNIYKKQTETINATWESVQKDPDQYIDLSNSGSGTWAEYAYYYGADLKNQRDFAALHYDLIGKRKNFDAAKDPASKLQEQLDKPIYDKAQSIGTVFGEFITADGFADQLLKNLNPLDNNEGWKKVLAKFNLDSDTSTDEVRDAIKAGITTGSAQVIRDNIKELQELGKTPTQKNLGASYIERPEEDTTSTEKSELYNKFKAAGYKGTEQEFYSDYMPDTSPEDIRFLSSVTKGKIPEIDTSFLKSSDPFSMLDKISELESPIPRSTKKTKSDSYFKIGLDDEEEDLPSADSFLGDYASLFK